MEKLLPVIIFPLFQDILAGFGLNKKTPFLNRKEKKNKRARVGCENVGFPILPSLVLGNVGEGSSVDGCSELEGGDDNRDWLLLLLVSLLKTGDWLLPVLWIGLEVQSSPGCFFWMSVVKDSKWGSREKCKYRTGKQRDTGREGGREKKRDDTETVKTLKSGLTHLLMVCSTKVQLLTPNLLSLRL